MERSPVSLERVPAYDPELVFAGLEACLARLGGMAAFVRPGQRVLLKPNLLGTFGPDRAVTTHPAVLRAAALLVLRAGGIPLVGDSPGMGRTEAVYRVTGTRAVMDELSLEAADFATEAVVDCPANRAVKRLRLAAAVAEADVIISLPKLKTHVQMAFTGALKNQFGLVVGAKKAQYHYRMQERRWLAHLMVDINRAVAPALAIVDAVVGMEGPGPSGGEPRELGLLIAGTDLAAVDRVACELIGLPATDVPILVAAKAQGYGAPDLASVKTVGADPAACRQPDWKKVEHLGDIRRLLPLPAALLRRLRKHLAPHPRIDRRRCVGCGACHDGCPLAPSAIHPKKDREHELDRARCIRCYCCHEFCPVKAISLERSWLDRRFGLVGLANRLLGL